MSDNPKAEPIRPTINDVNRAFWDGCLRGELLLQRCSHCGHLRYPAGAVCGLSRRRGAMAAGERARQGVLVRGVSARLSSRLEGRSPTTSR